MDRPELPNGRIQGFHFFWAFYVNGFRQTRHCQPCFRGSLSGQLNSVTAESGRLYVMDELTAFRYVYLCGVGVGPRNLLYGEELSPGAQPLCQSPGNQGKI
ncbi:MAG: hypothetical protein JWN34_1608 [Bryobacterales bacterium]|nr:hypothetical protein [Bryobacterales bacterium]